MTTRKVYVVRHGDHDWNDQPNPTKGLTPVGRNSGDNMLRAARFETRYS